ncbi:Pyruvate/2-oxoglutarate dehydrogenase complex, dihydrolipoamide dehydrogenase (E3) component [Cetobacterium ceti]|uniref:Pyruvate/2-oxoglutarate dehydrogenase complex, dihydrolipoamide dehydrogenase (E3) component n=1 Tax=Cetobacterium ceti TaxID=180163 RepID=A0A1T4NF12_9FUSO|nr:NAD(P)/FAD-dependent oxidoreductase [Cetobacterium ceti]SJZ77931.1 Pyruvate/2-oxoglutarate dehydrogenase complex, dihydrolipoamide dehydrogenase (E3) component [Cetobacterium ceti]
MIYDSIIIGGGAGGLTVAIGLAKAKKTVLLVEKRNLGGECTWSGCIPSKAFINLVKNNHKKEIILSEINQIIEKVYKHEDPEILQNLGIDLEFGEAKFYSDNEISVNNKIYTGKNIVIATGSSPYIPNIEGLDNIDYLTNENFFKLKKFPNSLTFIGGGVISLELAIPLKKLGLDINILEIGDTFLPNEDEEISEFYKNKLKNLNINLYLNCGKISLNKQGDFILIKTSNLTSDILTEKLFISAGRKPNLENLDLEKANILYDSTSIKVNNFLQTSNSNIYAIGDVINIYKFSHMAGYQGEIVLRNILFPFIKKSVNYKSIPWTIFMEPEFSRIGYNKKDFLKQSIAFKEYSILNEECDRSIISLEEKFNLKVFCDVKGYILGSYCIGDRAGEIISLLQFIKSENIPFYKLIDSIQSYPTYGYILRNLAKQAYIDHILQNPVISLFANKD